MFGKAVLPIMPHSLAPGTVRLRAQHEKIGGQPNGHRLRLPGQRVMTDWCEVVSFLGQGFVPGFRGPDEGDHSDQVG